MKKKAIYHRKYFIFFWFVCFFVFKSHSSFDRIKNIFNTSINKVKNWFKKEEKNATSQSIDQINDTMAPLLDQADKDENESLPKKTTENTEKAENTESSIIIEKEAKKNDFFIPQPTHLEIKKSNKADHNFIQKNSDKKESNKRENINEEEKVNLPSEEKKDNNEALISKITNHLESHKKKNNLSNEEILNQLIQKIDKNYSNNEKENNIDNKKALQLKKKIETEIKKTQSSWPSEEQNRKIASLFLEYQQFNESEKKSYKNKKKLASKKNQTRTEEEVPLIKSEINKTQNTNQSDIKNEDAKKISNTKIEPEEEKNRNFVNALIISPEKITQNFSKKINNQSSKKSFSDKKKLDLMKKINSYLKKIKTIKEIKNEKKSL